MDDRSLAIQLIGRLSVADTSLLGLNRCTLLFGDQWISQEFWVFGKVGGRVASFLLWLRHCQ